MTSRQPPPRDRTSPSSPSPLPPARRPPADDADAVFVPRSLLMDKEVITRTSGKRLGYINQLFVDPARLEVVGVYMRPGATSLGATSTDHVLVSSLRQIGDVVLVHDEAALLDPPADETYGYVRLVGAEVQTEDGVVLGKVRDYVFNPDNGLLASVRYDALGLPSIPQSLLSCWTLGWRDVVAVGPTRVVVRRGAERRAIKENEGWITEYVTALVNAVAGAEEGGEQGEWAGGEAYRSDPAYAAWYELHAAEYERYYGQRLPKPVVAAGEQRGGRRQQRDTAPQPVQRQQRPMALPPPQSTSYRQALQMDQQQQRQRQYAGDIRGPPSQQQARRGGGGGGGGGAPPRQMSMPRQADFEQQQMPSSSMSPPPQRPQPSNTSSTAPPRQVAALEPDAVIPTPRPATPRYRQPAEYGESSSSR